MHKLRTYISLCIVALAILVAQFIWHINLPYTLAGFRIRTENSRFVVTDCFPAGPAYKAGLRVGDNILRINDIEIKEFADSYEDRPFYDSYEGYSELYKIGETYEVACTNNFICTFKISDDMSFWDRLQCICMDNWTTFITGFFFIVFGIITSLFAINIEGTSDFVWLMLAVGLCISNGYTEAANTLSYSKFMLVTFEIATAFVSFAMFRSVAYFFMLADKPKVHRLLREISVIPIFVSIVKFLLIAFGATTIFNTVLVYMPMLLLGLSFILPMTTFIILMRRIKRQLSVILRFFFLGLCFSTMVPACTLIANVIKDAFWVSSDTETMYTILPLLFIPFSVFCAFFQTVSVNLDNLSGRLMNGGCTAVIISTITFFFRGSHTEMIILACLMVAIYIVLEKPVVSFLFPKIVYVQDKLDNLERDVYKCKSVNDILSLSSDWLFSMINAGFVAFCMFSDNGNSVGNIMYRKALDEPLSDAMLSDMIKERESNRIMNEKLMIHKKNGFSVPFYLSHKLVGFIFVGQKSKYSIFSSTEIRLVAPVARIIMESAMVIEINEQNRIVNEQNRYLADMQNRIVFSFADMIESRDGLTGQHVKRTSQIVVLIMGRLRALNLYSHELDPIDYEMIAMAAPLHDIGKIKVPDHILSKPGKLTEDEFEIIKTHPVEGEKIISKTMSRIENEKYLKFAKDMALYHHEKWNGTGYPYGLSGEEIPLCARIMAVADVFDALCSARTYKEAYSIDRAFEIFEESKGSHFEPCLVELLYGIRPDLEMIYAAG